MHKITKLLIISAIAIFGAFGATNTLTAPALAATDICNTDAAEEVKEAAGCDTTNDDALKKVVTNILNAIIGISGLVAVVFIIIGGVQYMTSTGDPSKTKKARDTILYASIGLIICALAFAIVNWTIGIIK